MSDEVSAAPQPFEAVPHWLLLNTSVSAVALRLFLVLKKYANQQGTAFPSRARLAQDLGLTVKTITRARDELVTIGALCYQQRLDERGDSTSNLYHVHWERVIDCGFLTLGGGVKNTLGGVKSTLGVGEKLPHGGVKNDPLNKTQLNKPNRTNSHPDGFEVFWGEYPKKTAKQDAFKAWKQAVKIAPPEVIIEGLRKVLPVWEKGERQFIPYPATWLRAGRWEDEVEVQPGVLVVDSIVVTLPNEPGVRESLRGVVNRHPGVVPLQVLDSDGGVVARCGVDLAAGLLAEVKGVVHPRFVRVVQRRQP